MEHNAIRVIKNFFESVNSRFGLVVECEIQIFDFGKFPVCRKDGHIVVVPAFFEHPDLRDNVRKVLLSELYSCCYLDREKNGKLDTNPGFMAKGICQTMGIDFISNEEIEQNLRTVRRKLYDDVTYSCYFSIGDELRESAFLSYQVVNIVRKGEKETFVTVKPIGHNLGKPEKTMTEEEVYRRCCRFRDLKDEKMDMEAFRTALLDWRIS